MPRKQLRPRAYALQNGHAHYEGRPCAICGNRRRFVSSRSCVACARDFNDGMKRPRGRLGAHPEAAIARLAARVQGEAFYQGHDCPNCGHAWRYVSNSECIACHERRHKARQRDYAAEYRARKPGPCPPLSSPLARFYAGALGMGE